MELTTYYDTDNQVVVLEAEGPVTRENIKVTARKALELSNTHICNYILFDLTKCPESQSIFQGYDAMKNMELTTGITRNLKCAVVYNPSIYPEERAKFIENVVMNRPNPFYSMFTSRQDAFVWLKSYKKQ